MQTPSPFYVLVVGFHHTLGPQVDYAIPALPLLDDDRKPKVVNGSPYRLPEEWKFMPFLALPDGAHQSEEDFTFFILPPTEDPEIPVHTTVFGVASYRQVDVQKLSNRSSDMTRNTVQKAIVVLSTQPMFGHLRAPISFVNKLFFDQLDFTKLEIVQSFADSLPSTLFRKHELNSIYTGASARNLVRKFGVKTISLVKLLLLEKKVLIYGNIAHRLCAQTLGLLSLVPGLLFSLAAPGTFETEDDLADFEAAGFPLQLAGQDKLIHPYLSLLQLDLLMSPQTKSFVVAVSNKIFQQQRNVPLDVFIDTDTGKVEIQDPALEAALQLTPSDKKFISDILDVVQPPTAAPITPEEETRAAFEVTEASQFVGSDGWIRGQFHAYFISMAATVLKVDQDIHQKAAAAAGVVPAVSESSPPASSSSLTAVESSSSAASSVAASEPSLEAPTPGLTEKPVFLEDYNYRYLARWRGTENYKKWHKKYASNKLTFNFGELAGHPTHVDDLQMQLAKSMDGAAIQENISRVVSSGSAQIGKAVGVAATSVRSRIGSLIDYINFDGSGQPQPATTTTTTTAAAEGSEPAAAVDTTKPATPVPPPQSSTPPPSSSNSSSTSTAAQSSGMGGWARSLASRASAAVKSVNASLDSL